MSNISAWSIRHPIPTIVLFLVLTFAGLFGFTKLRINNMPDIDFPMVSVTVTQTGAAPSEVETQITDLVEDAVASLSGVENVASTVGEGSSVTSIQFELDSDLTKATDDVRNAVTAIQSQLPKTADTPIVARVEAGDQSILTYTVDAPTMSPDTLSWYVDNDVSKGLLGLGGVSKVTRSGGVSKAILVKLDPDRLNAYGLTVEDVGNALAAGTANQSGGRTVIGAAEQSVRTLGRVGSIADLEAVPVSIVGGETLHLADLGTVVDGWEEPRNRARLDGKEVVSFAVFSARGSSQIGVTNAVRAAVAAMDKANDAVTFTEVTSSSDFVLESYDAALEALWIGALLAVAVVFLFLRDWRATLVSATALPLSLVPTFAVMAWFDLSLNSITLLALSLVVGILVDDAIVEIENIVRHMRQTGGTAYEAAIEAADEIGLAVVATTMTIVAVFVPVAFMPGIPGKLFASFAVAVVVSVLFSLLVARTLTPLMGAYLMRAGGTGHAERVPGWVRGYLRVLKLALRFRWTTALLGIVFFAASIIVATQLPTDFMPATDRGRAIAKVELPPGSTLAETDAAAKALGERLARQPEVVSVFASLGTSTEGGGGPGRTATTASVTSGTVTANLKPRAERSVSQQEFEARAGRLVAGIPGTRIQFGADDQSGSKVSITLVGADGDELTDTADALAAEMRGVAGLRNPISDAASAKPELVVRPDRERMAAAGVTTDQVARLLSVSTLGDSDAALAKYNLGDRQVYVIPTLTDEARGDLDRIGTLEIRGSVATVPLSAVASFEFAAGPTTITHSDGVRAVTVSGELAGLTLGQAREAIAKLPTMSRLPAGIAEQVQGDSKRMAELFSGFVMAIVTGILLMFATLALLFNSFLQPITILTALPLSIGGAFGFLWLTGSSVAVSALIGVLLLMGIAAKNSILLVEYAIVARRGGQERTAALIDAATKRARPIVMTSIAMGAGMTPIAFGFGADAESRAPMAVAVIGGLLSSTVLSLVYVPVVYTLVDDLECRLGRMLERLLPERGAAREPVPASGDGG